ncbi:DinB family protein [Ruania suaedae]|uniref:DinB family protein n=1 Tax=Ruania suaedae TaxID=2897774 RepID=UPI001E36633D|nr:DinB family protein [Ruania suaedae]UFU02067.1 DinB family protein [Ruania suaedae]
MPETKDWTWVLDRRCPQCGAEAGALELAQIPAAVRTQIQVWPVVLRREDVVSPPAPGMWSTLEYAAHVRDVLEVFDARLTTVLTEDDPVFEGFDPDAAALEGGYRELDPQTVGAQILAAGESLAARVEGVTAEQAELRGTRADGAEFTITSLMQYLLHDLVHHAWDVTEGRPDEDEDEAAESDTPGPPPLQAFAHRHRRVLGILLGIAALALALAYVFAAPPESDAGPVREAIVRWSVPGCWALISAAGACWAFDVRQQVRNVIAYAAVACWLVYLGARLL